MPFSWDDQPDAGGAPRAPIKTHGGTTPGVNAALTNGTTTAPGAPTPAAQTNTGTPGGSNPSMGYGWVGAQGQIAEAFARQGIEPTAQLVGQWGSNIDDRYLATILQQIQSLPRGSWTPPDQTAAPTPGTGSTGTSGSLSNPSYVDVSDPVQKAVLDAFHKKGLNPRDQGDFQYWVDHIKNSNGGWANQDNQNYWLSRMAQDQGGVGDYQERPEAGGSSGAPQFSYPDWTETFQAPSGLTEQNDPGFQERMQLGMDALQRSAAAKGTVLDTGTLKDINKFAQDYASNEYGQVYNRAATEYNQRYGQYLSGFQNALNTFTTNFGVDTNLWNRALTEGNTGWARLMDLSNLGLAGNAGSSGQGYAGLMGGYLTGAGNAAAAGTVAGGNAWGNALSNLANYGSQYYWNRPGAGGGGFNPYGYGGTY